MLCCCRELFRRDGLIEKKGIKLNPAFLDRLAPTGSVMVVGFRKGYNDAGKFKQSVPYKSSTFLCTRMLNVY